MELPRTEALEAAARELMQQLAAAPQQPSTDTLYGVLLVKTATGEQKILKGFSGLSNGQSRVPGWVPPLAIQVQMSLVEPQVLATLNRLKTQMISLNQLPERPLYKKISGRYDRRLEQLALKHRQKKQDRDRRRTHYQNTLKGNALTQALQGLNQESQRDTLEYHKLKQAHYQVLEPLITKITQADQIIKQLKQRYIDLSKTWQQQMHMAYGAELRGEDHGLDLTNWVDYLGNAPLDICQRAAAKLLHYAVSHGLHPLAMGEFWWGYRQADSTDSYLGEFYDPPPDEWELLMHIATIQPKQTFANITPLPIVYQDEGLIVVDKPAGLLSVPGRRYHRQDSVLSRLRHRLNQDFLQVVHRLDQATSGILVLALSPSVHKALSQQFAQHQVHKTYEAILTRPIEADTGTIDLPLWSDPAKRPEQSVSAEHGKPSVTQFQVVQTGQHTRVKFIPKTGRTHQLRVHAAHPQGLNAPIKGDALYGQEPDPTERLHLHAASLELIHPVTQKQLHLTSNVPF